MSTKLPAVILADFTTQLSSEISVGGTTATLASNLDDDGVALPNGLVYLTLDGSNSSKEHIQAVKTGTSLASIMSVSRQGVLTSGSVRKHRIGASVAITDFATIKYLTDLLKGTTNLDSTDPLEYDGTASISTANQLATKAYVDGVAIAGGADSSTTVKGIGRVSVAPVSATIPIFVGDNDPRVPTQAENDALVGTSGTPSSTNKYVTNDDTTGTGLVVRASALASLVKFGGNGADGALTVSSGTTNIDLGSSAFVVKNYTSISITGTGKVTFTNPASTGTIIVFKSQGNVTLTSSQTPMIDASVLGAAGTATFTTTVNANNTGSDATTSLSNVLSILGGKGSTGGAVGAAGSAPTLAWNNFSYSSTREKYLFLPIATGGGQGMSNISSNVSVTVGASGRGGGTFVIECAGEWNFTTAGGISVAGGNAVNSTSANVQSNAAGSGGGSGGYFLGLYGTLTANSGTVTLTAGTGATSDSTGSGGIRYGAGGGSLLSPGNAGTSSATPGVKTGGDGATGVSVIQANTDFA